MKYLEIAIKGNRIICSNEKNPKSLTIITQETVWNKKRTDSGYTVLGFIYVLYYPTSLVTFYKYHNQLPQLHYEENEDFIIVNLQASQRIN